MPRPILRKIIMAAFGVLTLTSMGVSAGNTGQKSKTLDDTAIMAIYDQVNSFDIETALIGEVKGHSPKVRALGKMVSGDHTGVRKAALALAFKVGVTPDLPASRTKAAKAHYEAIKMLRSKSGKEFDRAYLKHEIKFHEAAISAVEKLLIPSASHAEFKEHFKAVLPHFKRHLKETRRIAKELGVK